MGEDELPDQGMRTLEQYRHLLRVPSTIECPSMRIVGSNCEEPVFSGVGQIHVRSATEMDFVMHAAPRESAEAFKRLVDAERNSDDARFLLGVRASQYDGTEWNAGWTTISLGETAGGIWRLSGPISSLMTSASGHHVAPTSGIEVIYDSKLRFPLPLNMSTVVLRGSREVLKKRGRGGKTIEVAGTQVDFFLDPEIDVTWAVAATSAEFTHPFAENWVSEPLCLLLGQLVFPRLVARNFGDRSTIWIRPSPAIKMNTLATSILEEDPLGADDRFWEVYRQILTMIIRARDHCGQRNFEAHPLSRYYYEIIQAAGGSNWVWCMTLASAIEGITTKLLTGESDRKSDYDAQAIENLRDHIRRWQGDAELRGRILSSVALAERKGVPQLLKRFRDEDFISADHIDAWKNVRNAVMHGQLVSPWSERELEERMRLLAELMHRLSMKYIEQQAS